MSKTVSLTLWATNLSPELSGPDAWLARLNTVAAEAKGEGSEMVIAPEYVSEQWLSYCGKGSKVTDHAALMGAAGLAMPDKIQTIADANDIDIMAGSWPVADGKGGYNNGAHLFRAGGAEPLIQRKLCLTPDEKAKDSWGIIPANQMQVFDWNGLRCAIVICLDIELPALSMRFAQEASDLDLIICPSMTGKLTGYSRVFGCAKARAVELMTTVAVVGCIGDTPLGGNVSGASVFLPCEEVLGSDGRFAEIGPFDNAPQEDDLGPRLHVKDIPVGVVRNLRATQPEVWPGAWTSNDVKFAT